MCGPAVTLSKPLGCKHVNYTRPLRVCTISLPPLPVTAVYAKKDRLLLRHGSAPNKITLSWREVSQHVIQVDNWERKKQESEKCWWIFFSTPHIFFTMLFTADWSLLCNPVSKREDGGIKKEFINAPQLSVRQDRRIKFLSQTLLKLRTKQQIDIQINYTRVLPAHSSSVIGLTQSSKTRVLWFPRMFQKHAVRWIGCIKLPLGVKVYT